MHRPRTAHARSLRRSAPDAEQRLWFHLRDRRLAGYKFRRQVPIGPYFADFCCLDRRLVIELDGGHHADQAEKDQLRSRHLAARGYRVLRFWNSEVFIELDAVLERIRLELDGAAD